MSGGSSLDSARESVEVRHASLPVDCALVALHIATIAEWTSPCCCTLSMAFSSSEFSCPHPRAEE